MRLLLTWLRLALLYNLLPTRKSIQTILTRCLRFGNRLSCNEVIKTHSYELRTITVSEHIGLYLRLKVVGQIILTRSDPSRSCIFVSYRQHCGQNADANVSESATSERTAQCAEMIRDPRGGSSRKFLGG